MRMRRSSSSERLYSGRQSPRRICLSRRRRAVGAREALAAAAIGRMSQKVVCVILSRATCYVILYHGANILRRLSVTEPLL